MSVVIITGAGGLIGSESVRFFSEKGLDIVGIDNDMRSEFFGDEASTSKNCQSLKKDIQGYRHYDSDIRDAPALEKIFQCYGRDIAAVIHCAAQPSHDWAATDPFTDFSVNANGTLNLLQMTRDHAADATFLFLSTNKVYGDTPNSLPIIELEERWEIAKDHPFFTHGIDETMSIDQSKHSLFGVSKAAADLMVQEYGRYSDMKTACFRGGCLTGPAHSGTELHGFLAYLMQCAISGKPYTVFGYKGKQVRDNIHSYDLVTALWHAFQNPPRAAVYNIGGGRHSNCSILEAIKLCEEISGREMTWSYSDTNRSGDHIWWISDTRRFQQAYPDWRYTYDLKSILAEIYEAKRDLNPSAE